MMELSSLLALPSGLEVADVSASDELLTVRLKACAPTGICPLCAHAATHVRSYYTRFVADVPCAGRHVQLVLRVRKFRCDTASCPRKIFAERLGPFIEAWARKTTRLRKAIEAIGLSTCGEVGARLADRLGIAASPTVVLRRIMDVPLPPVGTNTYSVLHLYTFLLSHHGRASPSCWNRYPSWDRRFCASSRKNVWNGLSRFKAPQGPGSAA